jgi:nicotinate (nicotinamide) nucleotide adenylyltransferase
MEFFRRAKGSLGDFQEASRSRPVARLGVFPGSFNPITVAHVALAQAALSRVDEVVYILPRVFPHKQFSRASFAQRLQLLCAAVGESDACSIAAADGGLFVEIAEECRAAYGSETALTFLCGRDAAERIVNWDYGDPGALAAMLGQFDLLVAARSGGYAPPPEFRHGIQPLELAGEFDHVSATEVRERIARGEPWEHLVPPAARRLAGAIYK